MPVCMGCKFYNPIDATVGDCFGAEVPCDRDAKQLPGRCVPARGLTILAFEDASPIVCVSVMVRHYPAAASVCVSM